MNEKQYCPSCGEDVDTTVKEHERTKEICCLYCGFPLKEILKDHFSSNKIIMVVEDSRLLSEMIKDYFISNKLAKEILCNYDGGTFLAEYVRRTRMNVEIGLVILDIVMPVLSGINAAIAMRAIEKGFNVDKVPIIFFSVKKADEQLKKVMEFCAPSYYLCKATSKDANELCARLYKVANRLLLEIKEPEEEI